jgi:hypothetical protein
MAARIATVSGTALVPGVSKNGRLYSRELIAKAVARAQERLAEGNAPLTMLTHHAADDDSSRIVGSLRSISLAEDGSARFTADLADTDHGRTIASLVSGKQPHLKGVSIRGAWLGKVRRERGPDGGMVETADDLELDGLDYTRKPGVPGAVIDTVDRAAKESDGDRALIYESVEAQVTSITEETVEADAQAAGTEGPYADPGYRGDKQRRYPLDSKANAKAAWAFIGESANAKRYTPAQLKRIKGRIKGALKRFGVNVNTESWLVDSIAEAVPAVVLAEDYSGMYGDGDNGNGTFCLNATNGPVSVTVSSYCVDPADLELVLHAAVDGAAKALQTIDPDMDGDMDVAGAGSEDTDDDMGGESTGGDVLTETDVPAEPSPATDTPAEPAPAGDHEDPAPEAAADQPETEDPAMAEPTTAVEPTQAATPAQVPAVAPTITLSAEQFDAMLARFAAPAPAMAAAETAPVPVEAATETETPAAPEAVAETTEAMVARLVEEGVKAALPLAIQEQVAKNGPPTRKGLVAPVTEHTAPASSAGLPEGWPQKPLHEYSEEEWRAHVSPATVGAILGDRATQ